MRLDLDIHNYYEHLVTDYLNDNKYEQRFDSEFIADLCCLALTELPARYIRHDVDMAFYLSEQERFEMMEAVKAAVEKSRVHLEQRQAAD